LGSPATISRLGVTWSVVREGPGRPMQRFLFARQRRISAARQAGIPVREEVRERIPARLRDLGEGWSATTPCGEGEGRCQSNNDCKDHSECWHTASQVSPPGIDLSNVQDPDADVCFDPGVQSAYLGLGIKEDFVHFQAVLLRWIARGARL
jgi:hypothetical protein